MGKDRLEEMHNRGQEDASDGNSRDVPHCGATLFISTNKEEARRVEENKAYNEGYDHGKKQR